MGEAAQRLPLRHAVALGLLQGPTELLPVSSSCHTTLVPWFAGWPYNELDPALRKSFEVALHAGAAAALLLRPPVGDATPQPFARPPASDAGPQPFARPPASDAGPQLFVRPPAGDAGPPGSSGSETPRPPSSDAGPRRVAAKLGFLAAGVVPPALAGYALGGKIERRLSKPATIAAGLLAGSAAMIAAELRSHTPSRPVVDANALDGAALGVAQALALMPGVSRNGATLAVARARGFSRRDADRLSWKVGLPVIAGAATLKGSRLARTGAPRGLRAPLAAGAASAFLSTLAGATILDPQRRSALLPACAVYRAVLAALVIRRMRDNTSQHAHPSQKK